MKLTRLSAEDFDRIADATRLRDTARTIARAVLVDGRAQVDVARENGMSKQRVTLALKAVERAYAKTSLPNSGWIGVNLSLPEKIALELNDLVDRLQHCNDESQRNEAIERAAQALADARKSIQ